MADISKINVNNTEYNIKDATARSKQIIEGQASGSIASFSDGGDNIPMKSLEVAIVAQQASGTPSPSNPLPITGFSSVDLSVKGKNLFNIDTNRIGKNYDDSTENARYFQSVKLPYGTYTISLNNNKPSTISEITFGKADGALPFNNIGAHTVRQSVSTSGQYVTVTIDSSYPYAFISVIKSSGTLTADDINGLKFQIEKGNQATTYIEYTGTTTPVSLGQTIYGGTAELVGGNGTKTFVDRLDLGSLSWTRRTDTSVPIFQASLTDYGKAHETADIPYILCEIFNPVSATNVSQSGYDNSVAISADGKRIYIQCQTYTDATTFTNAINGKYVVYELATPVPFTFTGANIPTLSGVNNVYADSGDVNALEYFNKNADEIADLIRVLTQ